MSGLVEHYAPQARAIACKPGGGHLLLQLLSLDGWFVAEIAAFAGDGILFIAEHPVWGKVERQGESAATVAPDLLEDCLALQSPGPLH